MFYNFDKITKTAIFRAQYLAKSFGQKYTGSEHLLLSIASTDTVASKKMQQHGIDLKDLKEIIENICVKGEEKYKEKNRKYYETLSKRTNSNKNLFSKIRIWIQDDRKGFVKRSENKLPPLSPVLKDIFLKSYFEAKKRRHVVTVQLVLSYLLSKKNSSINKILENFALRRETLISELLLESRKHYVQHYRAIYTYPEKSEVIKPEKELTELIGKDLRAIYTSYWNFVSKLVKTGAETERIQLNFLKGTPPKDNTINGFKALAFIKAKEKKEEVTISDYIDQFEKLKKFYLNKENLLNLKKTSSNKFNFRSLMLKSFSKKNLIKSCSKLFLFLSKKTFFTNISISYSLEYDYFTSKKTNSRFGKYIFSKFKETKIRKKNLINFKKWRDMVKRRIKVKEENKKHSKT